MYKNKTPHTVVMQDILYPILLLLDPSGLSGNFAGFRTEIDRNTRKDGESNSASLMGLADLSNQVGSSL
jgi:hypothetical protein